LSLDRKTFGFNMRIAAVLEPAPARQQLGHNYRIFT
jgi:hypothetical protein